MRRRSEPASGKRECQLRTRSVTRATRRALTLSDAIASKVTRFAQPLFELVQRRKHVAHGPVVSCQRNNARVNIMLSQRSAETCLRLRETTTIDAVVQPIVQRVVPRLNVL